MHDSQITQFIYSHAYKIALLIQTIHLYGTVVTTLLTGYQTINVMQCRMKAGVKVSNISDIRI